MDYVTLMGAEQVKNAAREMANAAERMNQAANQINESLLRQQQFMEQWLATFEQILTNNK
jgi:RecA/RadA recombinase